MAVEELKKTDKFDQLVSYRGWDICRVDLDLSVSNNQSNNINQVDGSPLLGTMVRAVQADGRGYGRFSQGILELEVYKGSIIIFRFC